MDRLSWNPFVLCTVALALSSGCLITRHNTNVVRKNEKPRTVQFDTPESKSIFDGRVAEVKANKSVSNPRLIAVPFLLWSSSTDVVSDNGIYNDQIAICDTNGDGVISYSEANTYAAHVDEEMAKKREKAKIEEQMAKLESKMEKLESNAPNTVTPTRNSPQTNPSYQPYAAQPVSAELPLEYQQAPGNRQNYPTRQADEAPLPPPQYR